MFGVEDQLGLTVTSEEEDVEAEVTRTSPAAFPVWIYISNPRRSLFEGWISTLVSVSVPEAPAVAVPS